MTDAALQARDEQLIAAFAVILTHPAGFDVEIDGLRIGRVEDGRFCVSRRHVASYIPEDMFEDVRDAVRFYLDLRDEAKLGHDYEIEPTKPVPKYAAPDEPAE